jgi:hypothetical protein
MGPRKQPSSSEGRTADTPEAVALRHLRELESDNAFVVVDQVLNKSARRTHGSDAGDIPAKDAILGELVDRSGPHTTSRSTSLANPMSPRPRLNLARLLKQQHEDYLKEVELRAQAVGNGGEATGERRVKRTRKEAESPPSADIPGDSQTLSAHIGFLQRSSGVSLEDREHQSHELALLATVQWYEGQKNHGMFDGALRVSYLSMTAGPSTSKGHRHCAVCLLPASYRCARCTAVLLCSVKCCEIHDATRCLKFVQ